MKKHTYSMRLLVFVFLFGLLFSTGVSANAAELPQFTVIVLSAPEDLSISARLADNTTTHPISLRKDQKAWESYYRFFRSPKDENLQDAVLVVHSAEKNFECPLLDSVARSYDRLLTLNFKEETLTVGEPVWRFPLLASIRIVLTLLIEGLVFFLFGYRKKSSWGIFLITNLITQVFLNFSLSQSFAGSDPFALFILFEVIIFILEAAIFAFTLKEHKKTRAIGFSLLANLASLFLGGFLISYLPI